jgi:hypothetical protein
MFAAWVYLDKLFNGMIFFGFLLRSQAHRKLLGARVGAQSFFEDPVCHSS